MGFSIGVYKFAVGWSLNGGLSACFAVLRDTPDVFYGSVTLYPGKRVRSGEIRHRICWHLQRGTWLKIR